MAWSPSQLRYVTPQEQTDIYRSQLAQQHRQFGYGGVSPTTFPVFHGAPYQEGHGIGSLFSSLARWAWPAFKLLAPHVFGGIKEYANLSSMDNQLDRRSKLKRVAKKHGVNAMEDVVNVLKKQTGSGIKGNMRRRMKQKKSAAPPRRHSANRPKKRRQGRRSSSKHKRNQQRRNKRGRRRRHCNSKVISAADIFG